MIGSKPVLSSDSAVVGMFSPPSSSTSSALWCLEQRLGQLEALAGCGTTPPAATASPAMPGDLGQSVSNLAASIASLEAALPATRTARDIALKIESGAYESPVVPISTIASEASMAAKRIDTHNNFIDDLLACRDLVPFAAPPCDELAYVSQRLDGVVSRLGGRAEGAAAGAAPPCLRTATDLQCIDVDSVLETFEKSVSLLSSKCIEWDAALELLEETSACA